MDPEFLNLLMKKNTSKTLELKTKSSRELWVNYTVMAKVRIPLKKVTKDATLNMCTDKKRKNTWSINTNKRCSDNNLKRKLSRCASRNKLKVAQLTHTKLPMLWATILSTHPTCIVMEILMPPNLLITDQETVTPIWEDLRLQPSPILKEDLQQVNPTSISKCMEVKANLSRHSPFLKWGLRNIKKMSLLVPQLS